MSENLRTAATISSSPINKHFSYYLSLASLSYQPQLRSLPPPFYGTVQLYCCFTGGNSLLFEMQLTSGKNTFYLRVIYTKFLIFRVVGFISVDKATNQFARKHRYGWMCVHAHQKQPLREPLSVALVCDWYSREPL